MTNVFNIVRIIVLYKHKEIMKAGQIVMVYQKPLTKEQPEGKAKLLQRIPDNRDTETVENWEVKFLSDEFICERLISV